MPDTIEAAQAPPDLALKFAYVRPQTPSPRLDEGLTGANAYGLSSCPIEQYQFPRALAPIVESAKKDGLTYLVEASLPGATNQQTSDELSNVTNCAFNPAFFPSNTEYKGAILFVQADGSYALRDGVGFAEAHLVD